MMNKTKNYTLLAAILAHFGSTGFFIYTIDNSSNATFNTGAAQHTGVMLLGASLLLYVAYAAMFYATRRPNKKDQ